MYKVLLFEKTREKILGFIDFQNYCILYFMWLVLRAFDVSSQKVVLAVICIDFSEKIIT